LSSQVPSVSAPNPQSGWTGGAGNPGGPTIEVEPFAGYGGFWLRVVAVLIDWIILSIATAILSLPTGFTTIPFIGIVLHWLYDAGMTASQQRATLGKLAVGLKVTDYAGHRLTFARATGRHFAKWISFFVLCIGHLMVAFTAKKRGLHDLIAGTLVLKHAGAPQGPIAGTGP